MGPRSTVDLHIHTTASDGDLCPEEVTELAKESGIRIFSVTDHDTADGLEAAEKSARIHGLEFIPGMEISTEYKTKLHLLGYYIQRDKTEFQKGLEILLSYRQERERVTIEYLNGKGIEITAGEVRQVTGGKIIGRPHMAAVMVAKGYVSDKREAFERYLGTPEYLSLRRPKTTVEESIGIIRAGCGVPVLAHPHSLKEDLRELDETLTKLKKMGLEGIECYYNCYSKKETADYLKLATEHELLPTGGSDYHGPRTKPGVMIGTGQDGALDFHDMHIAEKLYERKADS